MRRQQKELFHKKRAEVRPPLASFRRRRETIRPGRMVEDIPPCCMLPFLPFLKLLSPIKEVYAT